MYGWVFHWLGGAWEVGLGLAWLGLALRYPLLRSLLFSWTLSIRRIQLDVFARENTNNLLVRMNLGNAMYNMNPNA